MTLQGTRIDGLVHEFDAACRALKETIESVPDDRWQVPTPADGRQVNVVAHHAAASHRPIAQLVQAMANGAEAVMTLEQVHIGNAAHALQFAACTKRDALDQNQHGAEYARGVLLGLTDEQLASTADMFIDMPMTVEQAIRGVLIHHPLGHIATIQSALS